MTLLFILSFIFCAILTKCCLVLFKARNIVDTPSYRRMHKDITPRGGGIALVITFALGMWFTSDTDTSLRLLPLLVAIAGISFIDDLHYVSAGVRLLTHIIVSAIAIYSFLWPHSLFHNELSEYTDYALAVLFFAGFINIYNFLDF